MDLYFNLFAAAVRRPDWPSDELAETGDRTHDLANRILAGLLPRVRNDLSGDALHLTHAEPRRHQLRTDTHDAAHAEPAGLGLHRSFCSGHLVDECLNFIRRTFLEQ